MVTGVPGNYQLNTLERLCEDLEGQMKVIMSTTVHDQLAVQRLRRKKVQVQENIALVKRNLAPDIIA